MFGNHVVEVLDEMPGQFVFVGLLGDDRLPRSAEFVDEARERKDEGFPEQSGLRAEVAEEEVLADSCGLGDFTRRGAAVVLAGEQFAGGIEQKSPRLAAGPADCCRRICRGPLLGGRLLGHDYSLLEPR